MYPAAKPSSNCFFSNCYLQFFNKTGNRQNPYIATIWKAVYFFWSLHYQCSALTTWAITKPIVSRSRTCASIAVLYQLSYPDAIGKRTWTSNTSVLVEFAPLMQQHTDRYHDCTMVLKKHTSGLPSTDKFHLAVRQALVLIHHQQLFLKITAPPYLRNCYLQTHVALL